MGSFICASDRELEDDPYYDPEESTDIIHNEITPEDQILIAHQYLKDFINKFETEERGGIHDFFELTLYNMLGTSIGNINDYLKDGHKKVDPTQIMHIVSDSYQKVLDGIKRNLDNMKQVNFK